MKDQTGTLWWPVEADGESLDRRWAKTREEAERPSVDSRGQPPTFEHASESEGDGSIGSSPSDLGYFMSLAGRFPLLTAQRERELAQSLWRARRRLLRAMEAVRTSRKGKSLELPRERSPNRRISPTARRRLITAEDYAERLLRLVEGTGAAGPKLDMSLSSLPAAVPRRRRGRDRGSWCPPLLKETQVRAISDLLRQELTTIHAVKEELVQHNLRLVMWVAKSYVGRGFDLVDLVQEGSIGLLRAIDRFDPAHQTRFSTFATHWIRQGISRALAEKSRMIRIPLNRLAEVREAVAAQARLQKKLSRNPTLEEIAQDMHLEVEKVEELLPALHSIDSLDAPLPSAGGSRAETLADPGQQSPSEYAEEEEAATAVNHLLEELPERQRLILAMRHGIGYTRESTLEEIGRALGLSRERVRQIEKTARDRFEENWRTAWRARAESS